MSKHVNGVIAPTKLSLHNLLQVEDESELRGHTADSLRSMARYAMENVKALSLTNPSNLVYQAIYTDISSVEDNIDDLGKGDLLDLLLKVAGYLKKIDPTTLAVDVVALDQSGLGSELNNIDFFKLISGPLNAVVQAQTASAMSTIALIKEIGFETDENGNPTAVRKVDFVYEKVGKNEDGSDRVESTKVSVPILAMVNIPSLRIQDVDIQFNAKINGVEEVKTTQSFDIKGEAGFGMGPFKLKVSASFQRSTTSGSRVEREYTMAVKVKATQDEMPPGLEKILNLLSA
jgi:hypothetical protein